jgi:ubiquinone/menaquinone biosynthesis C-methylase UbiE
LNGRATIKEPVAAYSSNFPNQAMATLISPQVQLEKTYNAAADHYDHPALSFWDRFGRRTIERSPIVPGMNVLDVCCGMGSSALPAAKHVGPSGHVVAVDLAQNLLNKGVKRAGDCGMTNIEFRRADLENLPFGDRSFDAVVCVFGIFFVPDLQASVRGLWRLVRPNGFLAITIWGAKTFEPADGTFWDAVRREDPELLKSIKPWNKIVEPDPFRRLLVECGVTHPEVVAEPGTHPLNRPEDWWTIILGSGYRSTVEALTPSAQELVRFSTVDEVRRQRIREIRTDVIYAIARRLTGREQ